MANVAFGLALSGQHRHIYGNKIFLLFVIHVKVCVNITSL